MFFLLGILPLCGQIDTIASQDFSKKIQISALCATVHIQNLDQQTQGSGVIINDRGPLVYILTANHVVDRTETFEISFFTEDSYPRSLKKVSSGKVLARKVNEDLALIQINTSGPIPSYLRVCPPESFPKTPSLPGLTVGCPKGEAPQIFLNQINGKKMVRKSGEKGSFPFWELQKATLPGCSGGPLIDRRGYLIGVASLSGDGKGYCCTIETIHGLLRENGLNYLYSPEK
jgi:S1-C subfamily serine protease